MSEHVFMLRFEGDLEAWEDELVIAGLTDVAYTTVQGTRKDGVHYARVVRHVSDSLGMAVCHVLLMFESVPLEITGVIAGGEQ